MLRDATAQPIVYSLNKCTKPVDVGWNATGCQYDLIYYIETNSHELRDGFVQKIEERLLIEDFVKPNPSCDLSLFKKFVANSDLNGRSNYLRHPELNIILKLYALSKIIDDNNCTGVKICGNFSSLERNYIHFYFKSIGWKNRRFNFFYECNFNLYKICANVRFFFILIKNSIFFYCQNLMRRMIYFSLYGNKSIGERSCQKDILFLSYRQIIDLDPNKNYTDPIWKELPSLCANSSLSFDYLYLSLAKKHKDFIKEKKISCVDGDCLFHFIDFFCHFNAVEHFFNTLRVRRLWEISGCSRNDVGVDICLSVFFKKTLCSFYLHQNFFLQSAFNNFFIQACQYRFILYPMENYHWEKNLIGTLRRLCPDTKVIAVPNTAVRFWDLKFVSSFLPINGKEGLGNNKPDLVCAPCEPARAALIDSGWDAGSIIVTEALRYLIPEQKTDVKLKSFGEKIVVVGDYVVAETLRLLEFLQLDAFPKEFSDYEVVLKLHPSQLGGTVSRSVPATVEIATGDLESVLNDAAIAICSSSTNGVIDCWESGVEVLVIGDKRNLNFCPISHFEGVSMVYDRVQLWDRLQTVLSEVRFKNRIQHCYFERGPELSRWSSLLRDGFEI